MKKPNNPWKFGIFYYNPDDKRLLPPKRIPGLGWTVNFANWKSVLLLLAILLATALVAILVPSPDK